MTVVGLAFAAFGLLFGCMGPLVAVPMMRRAQLGVRALRIGKVAQGQIVEVSKDTSQSINGQNPWRLRYLFDSGATVFEGTVTAWEWQEGEREPEEPVWVVYLPETPEFNALWPPVK